MNVFKLATDHFGLACDALHYANRYPEKVEAVIGIDTSVPKQADFTSSLPHINFTDKLLGVTGLIRTATAISPYMIMSNGKEAYTDEEFATIRKLTIWNFANVALYNEGEESANNFAKVYNMEYSQDVLLFVSRQNADGRGPWWLQQHEEQVKNLDKGKVVILDGSHYLRRFSASVIAEPIKTFVHK